MVSPSFQTEAATNFGTGTTGEITKPASLADDDCVLIGLVLDGDAANANMDAETGWTRIAVISEGSVELFVFAKRITDASGEPATWTVNWTGSEKGRAQAIRVSGCHTSGNFWEVGSSNTGVSTTIQSNGFNTSSDDQLCIAFHGADRDRISGSSTVGGTGWSIEIPNPGSEGSSTGAGLLMAEKDIATAGATENATTTISSDGWAAIQVSLQSIAPVAPSEFGDAPIPQPFF